MGLFKEFIGMIRAFGDTEGSGCRAILLVVRRENRKSVENENYQYRS